MRRPSTSHVAFAVLAVVLVACPEDDSTAGPSFPATDLLSSAPADVGQDDVDRHGRPAIACIAAGSFFEVESIDDLSCDDMTVGGLLVPVGTSIVIRVPGGTAFTGLDPSGSQHTSEDFDGVEALTLSSPDAGVGSLEVFDVSLVVVFAPPDEWNQLVTDAGAPQEVLDGTGHFPYLNPDESGSVGTIYVVD